jgi:hypothetical protein
MRQQEFDLREILKMVKDRCYDKERQTMVANISEKSSSALYRGMNFSWGKRKYIEHSTSKERIWIGRLLAGMWKLKGIKNKAGKGICLLCLGEDDVIHILLNYLETIYGRNYF